VIGKTIVSHCLPLPQRGRRVLRGAAQIWLGLGRTIKERTIAGKTVYVIGAGALIVCLPDDIRLEVEEGIAALKEQLKHEVMRVVFKDSGFADDVVKTNAVQILRQAEIEDVKGL
jgi:adenine-specific DNA-methyltransferase